MKPRSSSLKMAYGVLWSTWFIGLLAVPFDKANVFTVVMQAVNGIGMIILSWRENR